MRLCSILVLLLAAGSPVLAGTDGYLRYTRPTPLRFANPPPARPPVNELILALDRPAEPKPAEEPRPQTETGFQLLTEYLNSVVAELLSKPAVVPLSAGNPAAAAPAVAAAPEETDPTLDVLALASQPEPPENEARLLPEILTIFNTDPKPGEKSKGVVVVAPPVFMPPQPMPASRAVYRNP